MSLGCAAPRLFIFETLISWVTYENKMPETKYTTKEALENSGLWNKWVKGHVTVCRNVGDDENPEWVVVAKRDGLYDMMRFFPVDGELQVSVEVGRTLCRIVMNKLIDLLT